MLQTQSIKVLFVLCFIVIEVLLYSTLLSILNAIILLCNTYTTQ